MLAMHRLGSMQEEGGDLLNRHPPDAVRNSGLIVRSSHCFKGSGRPPPRGGLRAGTQNRFDEILERLARIEAQLEDAPSASATFCISQGQGLELKGKFAAEAARKWTWESAGPM